MAHQSQNHREGFADGCNEVPLTDGHTSEYIAGYNEGQAKCHNNNGNDNNNSAGSSSGSSSGSTSNGNILTLNFPPCM
jgi:hypothetical protein